MCEHCRNIAKLMEAEPDRDWSRVVFVVIPVKKRIWWPRTFWLWRNVIVGYRYAYGEVEVEIAA